MSIKDVQAAIGSAESVLAKFPDLIPFGTALEAPTFPSDALPEALRGIVRQVVESVQVPPDLPALLGLAVASAASMGRVDVSVGMGFREPLNLYAAVAMEPGARKSPVFREMTAPLHAHEAALISESKPKVSEAKAARAVAEERIRYFRREAAKPDADVAGILAELTQLESAMPEIPDAPRLLCDDATPEGLAALMSRNGGQIAVMSSEGGIFGILAGRYAKDGAPNLDLFLKAHDGDRVAIDRATKEPIVLERPLMTIGLTVQPDVLASLADTPSFRGRGLLGRFLYSMPRDLVGTRLYQDRPVGDLERTRYQEAIRSILAIPATSVPLTVSIEADALEAWRRFADAIEREQADGFRFARIRDWASKLAGKVARIAGIRHLLELGAAGVNIPIAVQTVLVATAIGEYLAEHALSVFNLMGASQEEALAQRILKWATHGRRQDFTHRDAYRNFQSHGAEAVALAIQELEQRGYVIAKPLDRKGPGRKPSPAFILHPLAIAPEAPARAEVVKLVPEQLERERFAV